MILIEGICLRKKWENPTCVYDDSNTKIHTEELAPLFKCDDCKFEGLSYKIVNIHNKKQHKIWGQADGKDNEDIIEDLSLHTFLDATV